MFTSKPNIQLPNNLKGPVAGLITFICVLLLTLVPLLNCHKHCHDRFATYDTCEVIRVNPVSYKCSNGTLIVLRNTSVLITANDFNNFEAFKNCVKRKQTKPCNVDDTCLSRGSLRCTISDGAYYLYIFDKTRIMTTFTHQQCQVPNSGWINCSSLR